MPSIRISCVFAAAIVAQSVMCQDREWLNQFGTNDLDAATALAPDGAGGVFVTGNTGGDLGGENMGGLDVWLERYDGGGDLTWARQIGSIIDDGPHALAPDGSGGVFVAGYSVGNLGGENAGGSDAWLARYDNNGTRTWIRQFGSSANDYAYALAPDGAGGVYIAGETAGDLGGANSGYTDIWLARYDSNGSRTWIRHFGTTALERGAALAPDGSGGVFIAGYTGGSLGGGSAGGSDAWLARYTAAGSRAWIRQFGTSSADSATALAPNGSGGVMIACPTSGNLGGANAGGNDAWLALYDGTGDEVWITQIGTATDDTPNALAPDGSGGVFIGGYTDGSLGGANIGHYDPWLAQYESGGSQIWANQFGSTLHDRANALATDGSGNVFIAGFTWGQLGGINTGNTDAWLALYAGSPATTVPLTGYTVNRGARTGGNLQSLLYSDPFYLKIASDPGDIYHTSEITVKATSNVLNPSRLDLQTETKANANYVQTRISLRNVNTNTWVLIGSFAQPQIDTVKIFADIANPERFIRQSDGLIRVRVQSIRALSRGAFTQFTDHVKVTVYE